jgi:hypothetical protein
MASAQEGLQIQIGNSPVAAAVVDYINNTNVETINQKINSVRNGAALFTDALSNVIANYSQAVTDLISRAGSNIFNAKAQLGSLGTTIFVKIKYSDTAQQIGEAVRGEMSVETLRKILLERFERVLLDVARNKTSDPNLQSDTLGEMIKRGQKIGGGDRLLLDALVDDPKIRDPISYMGENYATKVKGRSPMLHAASREKYANASRELTQMAKDMTEHTAWELKSDEIASELRDLDDVRNRLEDDAYLKHIIKSILDNLINRRDGTETMDDQMWAGPASGGLEFLQEKVTQVLDVATRKLNGINNKELFYVPAIFATWNVQKEQFDIYFNDIRARILAVKRFLDMEMDNFNGMDFNQFPELQLVEDANKAATINRIKQDGRLVELQELANRISGDVINIDKWTLNPDGSLRYDGREVAASAETNIVSRIMSLIVRARQILQSGQAGQIAGRLLTLENGLVNFTLDFNPRTIIPGNFNLTEPGAPMPRQIDQGITERRKNITKLTKYNREINITHANRMLDQAKVKDQTRVQKAAAAGRGLSMLAAAAQAVPVFTNDMTIFDQTPAQAAEETARIVASRRARDNRNAEREDREEDEIGNRTARDAAGGRRRQYRKTRKMKGGRRTGARKTARRVRRRRTMKRKANRRTGRQRKTRR